MPSITLAAPCAGFADVDSASAFCANVEWVKNRGVTLGCSAGFYCPNDPVSRLAMAAFLNRLGTALTPVALRKELGSGALDPDATPVVCQTDAYAVAGFPRRAIVDITLSGSAAADVGIAAMAVVSWNGGASWTALSPVAAQAHIAANRWNSLSNVASVDVEVGATLRFGIQVSRTSGAADLSDSRCYVRALLFSRDGASSPF